ncbi:acetyl-CoA carboxylase biotin carboxyl carrier protein subunit [Cutibacterium granulosum]|uniref:acetyl-CoA carboxylase biotin carboxyl carrier protein subunit n=1 Tax=Cutibacterium granulosum TaxID=33011 RepID=UPI002B23EE11|nr:acetyl-CoA carboxylase biotin carboxyl carrier protein subunit [Cutibacterium granulosum]MEA5643724.1 acetyl-CoA carboxylase biotin carboxyl carrier protein subunit [Cutibacterium granulosum]
MKLKVTVNDVAYDVDVDVDKTPNAPLAPIMFGGGSGPALKASAGGGGKAGAGEVPAPLAGTVAKILCAEGDAVKAGDVLLTLEAMKMETEINATADGKLTKILVAVGDAVQGGQGLVALES